MLPNMAVVGARVDVGVSVCSAFATRGNGCSRQASPVVLCDYREGELTRSHNCC